MGWFSSNRDSEPSISIKKSNEKLSLPQFGYHSVKWSVDTQSFFDSMEKFVSSHPELPKNSLINKLLSHGGFTEIHLISHAVGAYLAIAMFFLKIPPDQFKNILIGMKDGFRNYCTINGRTDADRADYLENAAKQYSRHILEDYNTPRDKGVVDVKGGPAFQYMLNNIKHILDSDTGSPLDIHPIEAMYLKSIIDPLPYSTADALINEIQMTYIANS